MFGPYDSSITCAYAADGGSRAKDDGCGGDFCSAERGEHDGWCDGRQVEPWEVDVTTQLSEQTGEINTLTYRGLYNNSVPNPSSLQQGAPVMMLRVTITFYALQ